MIYQHPIECLFDSGNITAVNASSEDIATTVTLKIPPETDISAFSSLVSENREFFAFCPLGLSDSEILIAISGVFPAGEKLTLSFSEEPAAELSRYPETLKTAENDFIHLTVNDSGTLVISDKQSGNVYFEMLTAFGCVQLSEQTAAYTFSSAGASVMKLSSPLLTCFDIRQSLPFGSPEEFCSDTECSIRVAHRVALAANERALRVTSLLGKDEFEGEVTFGIRFPTGADAPTVIVYDDSGVPSNEFAVAGETFAVKKGGSVTVTGESGSAFKVSRVSEDAEVCVSEDGNIDLLFPAVSESAQSSDQRLFSYVLEPIEVW